MPPKKPLVEELIEAMRNADVAEAIGKALAPLIQLTVGETIKNEISNVLAELAQQNKTLRKDVDTLTTENVSLKSRLADTENRLEELDRNQRHNSIIIRGLPETTYAERASASEATDAPSQTHESVERTTMDFFHNTMHVQVNPGDIGSIYRMKSGPKDTVRPIMVNFCNTKTRNAVMASKKTLKDDDRQIFLAENLTKATADRFYKARTLVTKKKIHATWTRNGHVFIKLTNDDTSRPIIIKNANDLPR